MPLSTSRGGYNRNLAKPIFCLGMSYENTQVFLDEGIAAHTLHPGPVPTKILRKFFPKIFLPVYPIVAHYYLKSAEEGAQTSIYCAVSEELEGVSGKYYVDCKEAEEQASDLSRDMGLSKKLWEVSEKHTGLATTK